MKIVICATTFPPALGGLENVAEMTADALGRAGDEVTVLTRTPGPPMPDRAYRLIRQPSFARAFQECRAADVAVLVNVGLKMLPPLLASRTPFAIWHHTLHHRVGVPAAEHSRIERLKALVLRRAASMNIACSRYVAGTLPVSPPVVTVPNPYDTRLFRKEPSVTRTNDLLFVGRFVSEKGVDVLLRALALPDGPLSAVGLSLVGSGPEEARLRAQVDTLGLGGRVTFVGVRRGEGLRQAYAGHRVVVVPSTGEETFGVVALEALACGCGVAVSRSGGIAEAIGTHGVMFNKGDAVDCARAVRQALDEWPGEDDATAHLERHGPDGVARAIHVALTTMTGGAGRTV